MSHRFNTGLLHVPCKQPLKLARVATASQTTLHCQQQMHISSSCSLPCPALLLVNSSLSGFLFSDSNFPFLQKNKYSFGALEGYFHYQDPHPCLLVCPQYLLDCWFFGSQSKLCDMLDLWYIAWLGSLHIRLFKLLQQTKQMLTIPQALLKQNFSQLKNGSNIQGQCGYVNQPRYMVHQVQTCSTNIQPSTRHNHTFQNTYYNV